MDVIEEGYTKAVEALHKNVTKLGFTATPERHANYYSVWARDHAITALAAILTGDEVLEDTALKGVKTILRSQESSGQVASYVEIESRKKVYGGLGSITSVDSNMWILITAAQIYKRKKRKSLIDAKRMLKYKRLYRLLRAFDSNNCGLLEVHIAGDWADVFNRTYHVLYDECLYYEFLRSLEFMYKEAIHHKTCDAALEKKLQGSLKYIHRRKLKAKREINRKFWITTENKNDIREEYMIHNDLEGRSPFYQSHLSPFRMNWEHRFETLGNLLAIVTDISPEKRTKQILSYIKNNKINEPMLRSLSPPVFEHDLDWEPIYSEKEHPHVYHNGGMWPFVNGFYIYALAKNKQKRLAKRELLKFAEAMKENNWLFNEHYHGESLEALGRNNQAWSAAGYIIAYHAVKHGYNIFS